MKTCPSCRKTYEDDTLVFCLDDGSRLEAAFDSNATWNLPVPGPTVASPRLTAPNSQPTITARPEHFQVARPQVGGGGPVEERRKSVLPWVFAIVLVLGASGVLIAWMMTRSSGDDTSGKYPAPTPEASISVPPSPEPTVDIESTPERSPVPTPTKERSQSFAMLDNTSFDGSRITFYPKTSFALCQADCAANPFCKGLTWIRPGAYNPNDPGMCYLMSAVTKHITQQACCISAVR